jgi:hypothetical protein
MAERKRGSAPEQKASGRAPDLKRRLLPSDFRKYLALSNTEKVIDESGGRRGFFQFPKELKGAQDFNIRDFLVFYFDDKEDYEIVRKFFEKKSHATAHPILDEKKLADIVRERTSLNAGPEKED